MRGAPRLILRPADVFSLEASFVLYLVSGRFKGLPELRDFPIDFTVLFLSGTCALLAWQIASGRLRMPPLDMPVVLMILFSEFAVLSLFWSSMEIYNTSKALRFIALTSPSFFIARAIAPEADRRDRFLRVLIWFSIGLTLYYCYYRFVLGIEIGLVPGGVSDRIGRVSDNYQEYGSHAAIVCIAFLTLGVFGSRRQLCVAAVVVALALYTLAAIGGRGALAVAVLAAPLLAAGLLLRAHGGIGRLSRLAILVGILATCGAVGFLALSGNQTSNQFTTLERYQAQLSGQDTSSLDERTIGRDHAYRQWLRKPLLGWGIGEFEVEDPYLKYPHNLLLEVLMETGLVGALLLFSVVAFGVTACVGMARDATAGWTECVLALLFLTDLASLLTVQGFLADDRIFFAYIGMAIGTRARELIGSRRAGFAIPRENRR